MLGDVSFRTTHATAQPRGVAVTPDGRYAVVSGGAQLTAPPFSGYGAFCEKVAPTVDACGTLWMIDLKSNTVVATVTGVGNKPYMVDITEGGRGHHHTHGH